MTNDEIIAVVQAHKDGKKIECSFKTNSPHLWGFAGKPCWDFRTYDYRIAPTPVLRPWNNDEFPLVGVLYRRKDKPDFWATVSLTYVSSGKRYITTAFDPSGRHANLLLADDEHSTDNGVSWKPCGVMEEQK